MAAAAALPVPLAGAVPAFGAIGGIVGGAGEPVSRAGHPGAFTDYYSVRDGRDAIGRGNGAVFEVIPLESAYTDRRLFPTVRRAGPVLAMKQIYKDAATAEQVWQREVKEQLDLTFKLLRDESTADENAHALSTLALTLDGFKEGPDEHGKCLVRIIMFRAPTAVPFAYPHRPGDLEVLPAHKVKLELCGARADMIDNTIVRAGMMQASQVHYVMRQLLTALRFLHAQGMVHRDVKPENLLVWGTSAAVSDGLCKPIPAVKAPEHESIQLPWVKLADFGFTRAVAVDMTSQLGTRHFMAPELVTSRYSSKVDIFAAGCVLYVLLTGRLPSEDYTRVKINERFPLVDSLRRIEQAHALLFALEAMVDSRPERRPSADDLLSRKEYFG